MEDNKPQGLFDNNSSDNDSGQQSSDKKTDNQQQNNQDVIIQPASESSNNQSQSLSAEQSSSSDSDSQIQSDNKPAFDSGKQEENQGGENQKINSNQSDDQTSEIQNNDHDFESDFNQKQNSNQINENKNDFSQKSHDSSDAGIFSGADEAKDEVKKEGNGTDDTQIPNYPFGDNSEKEINDNEEKLTAGPVVRAVIIIIIIAAGIWFFNRNNTDQNANVSGDQSEDSVSIIVDDTKEQGEVTIISEEEAQKQEENKKKEEENKPKEDEKTVATGANTIRISAYYSKDGESDCHKVYPLEREIEKKYDIESVNALRALLTPLTEAEKKQGFVSRIPVGVYLNNVRIVGSGVATVDLTSALNNTAGSCAVDTVRAQIEQTLKQFDYVSSVVICVDSNCDRNQVLQP